MTIDQLIGKFEELYKGNPWHGASMLDLLGSVPSEHFNKAVEPTSKSVAHLIEHLLAWRQFAVKKMKGDRDFDIELSSVMDWPLPNPVGDVKAYYLAELEKSQADILMLLRSKSDEWLMEPTPNKKYNNAFLMQGILEHDLYHSGQIGIFNALLKAQNNSN
ncbi:MAG: DinB family protein [Reichenbachiella sp.]|uniref:DinB family protein n=1 Tax=Reichenbachiella sp. TaxID=2184521 RepID=UPI0032664926